MGRTRATRSGWILFVLGCVTCGPPDSGDGSPPPPPDAPASPPPTEPDPPEPPLEAVAPQPLQLAEGGVVEVRVAPSGLATRFADDPKDPLARLSPSPKAAAVYEALDLSAARRVAPWLEVRAGEETTVLTDAEDRGKRGKRARSPRAAAAMAGVERDLVLSFHPRHHPERICERLRPLPDIERCTPRYRRPSLAPIFPDDPQFGNQWGFHNTEPGGPDQAPDFDINLPEAWDTQQGDASIVVAVIDSGVDIRHADLYEKIWINVDELPAAFVSAANALSVDDWPGILTFTDLDSDAPAMVDLRAANGLIDVNGNGRIDGEDLVAAFADGVDDDPGVGGLVDDIVGWNFNEGGPLPFTGPDADHGTAVAGLVGASTDNGLDTAGVGWNVRILAIRGDWSWPSIQYAMDRGADVITSSLDADSSPELSAIAEDLDDEGIVLTASLGNVDRYISGTAYAELPEAIAVSNFGSRGVRAFPSGSSYSVNTDVAGPGSGTWSTDWESGAGGFGGTSGANPIIAGIVSLLVAERGGLGPEQIRQVLLQSAMDVPTVSGDQGENTPGFDYYSGWGLARADAALSMVHEDPWAAANLVSPAVSYRSAARNESLHVIGETADIAAYAGLPGGGNANVTLEWAPGAPPDATSWTTISSASLPFVDKGSLGTLARAALPNGVVSTRLTVEAGGRTSRGWGRIDVPRAYIDLVDNRLIFADLPELRGFAFHPSFDHYRLEAAAGHTPDESDPSAWTTVGSVGTTARPPIAAGVSFVDQALGPVTIADLPDGEATLRAAVYDAGDARLASFSVPILVDKTTFPPQSGFPADLGWPYRNGGAVAYDLTGDGQLELIVTQQVEVHVYRADGTELGGGWPADVGDYLIGASPAVGDIDGDGLPEVVVRASDLSLPRVDRLFVFDHQGHTAAPWGPLDPGTINPWMGTYARDNPPVLADLDADGDLEILATGVMNDASADAVVQAFQGNGDLWATYELGTGAYGPVAVGDLDADGDLELAALGHDGDERLVLFEADTTAIASVSVGSSPQGVSLADLDDDGDLEIVATTNWEAYAVHHDGTPVAGWEGPVLPPGFGPVGSPVFGDLSGSAAPEVVFTFADYVADGYEHGAYALDASGATVAGFTETPQAVGFAAAQPNLFDIDNDGEQEILFGPSSTPDDVPYGFVNAVDHDGSLVTDDRLPIYFTGALRRAPAVADLDRDGDLEYGAASNAWGGPVEVFDLEAANDPGAVAWSMARHNPQRTSNYHDGLRLLEPTTTAAVDVGPFDDPAGRHLLLIRLRHELGHGTVAAADLSVSIGGLDAPVSSLTTVEGEHWLTVAPPSQPGAGSYLLEVVWNDGGISRVVRHRDAVIYGTAASVTDQVVVVDRSGSMLSSDKHLSARTAGNFYVSARGASDTVGVVSFFTEPVDELLATSGSSTLTLGPDGSGNRGDVAVTIDGVTPPGPSAMTSIGIGLQHALTEVLPDETSGRQRALVLLSDGLENTAPFWDMGADPVRELFEQPEYDDVVVHTIALGPDADRDLHAAIAEATGGTSRFVYLGNSLSIYARLADAYKQVEDLVGDRQRIFTEGGDLSLGEPRSFSVRIPAGAAQATFALSHRDAAAVVKMRVRDPNGEVVTGPVVTGPTSRTMTVTGVSAGVYEVEVETFKASTEVLLTCSVATPTQLVASLAWLTPEGPASMSGTLLAMVLAEGNRERKVKMTARVVAPDKSETTVVLHDDGAHRDGAARDGVFAAPISLALGGGYAITVQAAGGRSQWERTVGYFQARGSDADLDGIPDAWERLHFPGLPPVRVSRLADVDADGLNNDEEFRYRTDPLRADTDGDGRPDGVEVFGGTDPAVVDPPRVTTEDSDGDGIEDAWEARHFRGAAPGDVDAGADPDGDGLSNLTESRLGTNPNSWDSDGDGVGDGTEVIWAAPGPGRGWQPQPEAKPEPPEEPPSDPPDTPDGPPKSPWWIWLWVLLLALVVVVVIVIVIRRRRT